MPDEDDLETSLEPVDAVSLGQGAGSAEARTAVELAELAELAEVLVDVLNCVRECRGLSAAAPIEFANAGALRAYVRRIHTTAVLLWGTFYSLDMGEYAVLYYFVQGLFVGWATMLCCKCPRSLASSSTVYALLCVGIMAVNHPETGPTGGGDVVAVCVLPVVFSATWMLWVDPRTVGEDAKGVFVTCVLVCGLVVAMSDWRELRDMLSSTCLAFVFLVVVEPLIKGLVLSVLVVSVRTQQKRTMMLVFVSTYALASLYLGCEGLGSRVLYLCTVGMTALLCAMQLGAVVVADVHGLVREDKNYMTCRRI